MAVYQHNKPARLGRLLVVRGVPGMTQEVISGNGRVGSCDSGRAYLVAFKAEILPAGDNL